MAHRIFCDDNIVLATRDALPLASAMDDIFHVETIKVFSLVAKISKISKKTVLEEKEDKDDNSDQA